MACVALIPGAGEFVYARVDIALGAAYETPILVPCQDPLVMAIQREIVREAYLDAFFSFLS